MDDSRSAPKTGKCQSWSFSDEIVRVGIGWGKGADGSTTFTTLIAYSITQCDEVQAIASNDA